MSTITNDGLTLSVTRCTHDNSGRQRVNWQWQGRRSVEWRHTASRDPASVSRANEDAPDHLAWGVDDDLSSRMRVVTSLKRAWRKPDELAVRQAIVVAWRRAVSVALSAKQTRYRQELWVTSSGISVRGGIKVTIFIPSTSSYSLSSWFTSSCTHHLITVTQSPCSLSPAATPSNDDISATRHRIH